MRIAQLRSYDHDFSGANYVFEIGGEQRANVGNHFFDVLAIRTRQPSDGNVLIPDPHLAALTQKPLDQLHLGTFSQVIRPGFEAKSQHADLLLSRLQDGVDGTAD